MHITFAGDVILCCQDWRRRNIIGNLRQRSLLDIWNSDAYNQYRNDIYAGCGQQPIICTNCKLAKPVT
jgi:radical SAM protein with 4Fe4S-binding SPASM domain